MVGQSREDALVHTNHTYHAKTRDGDQTSVVDRRDTLDNLQVVVTRVLVNERSLGRGVEGILDDNRDVLVEHREDSRRIDDLRTKVAKFHSLDERKLVDDVSRIDDAWVSGHETIDIGPYLKHVGIEGSSNNGSGVVRTTTSQIGHFSSFGIATDETAQHDDWVGTR